MTQKEALTSMGYREMSPGKWGKPIGSQLFTFNTINQLWDNWFKTPTSDKIHLWNSDKYVDESDNFLEWLKAVESMASLRPYVNSEFSFLTLSQKIDI